MNFMRLLPFVLAASLLPLSIPQLRAGNLTEEDRIEILRGLTAEFATAKVPLPRSKKPLEYKAETGYDKAKWTEASREFGPAARIGDLVQVTKVTIEGDRILLEINNGLKTKKKWYERVEVGMGGSTRPIGQDQGTNAPGGTYVALVFDKTLPVLKAAEIKKMLAPILDFEKHSATEQYIETLPPEIKKAITDKRVIEGMDRDQVLMAIGRPRRKTREVKDGVETEDWIYGEAPGRITFVTLNGSKVVKVKETYAGLGGSTVDTPAATP
jgi:hypothetical protein